MKNEKIIVGSIIFLVLILVSWIVLMVSVPTEVICEVGNRHLLSLNDPSKYNDDDIIRFAENGIDIHNWVTTAGGRMTPYRNSDGTYHIKQDQKNLIKTLYSKDQKIFWIGISLFHIKNFGFPQAYTETANAIKPFINFFNEQGFHDAKIGIYTGITRENGEVVFGLYQDEPIAWLKEGYTWDKQFEMAETTRSEIKSRLTVSEWSRIKWLITGHNIQTHDNKLYELTNDCQSYWAHHTDISEPNEAKNLVHHHSGEVMSSDEWQEKWKNFKKLAWTDMYVVEGGIGNRQLTVLGEKIFGLAENT